jgi:hypothetical protein
MSPVVPVALEYNGADDAGGDGASAAGAAGAGAAGAAGAASVPGKGSNCSRGKKRLPLERTASEDDFVSQDNPRGNPRAKKERRSKEGEEELNPRAKKERRSKEGEEELNSRAKKERRSLKDTGKQSSKDSPAKKMLMRGATHGTRQGSSGKLRPTHRR